MITYTLTKYYHSRMMPWLNFVVLMLLLSFNHLKTQFTRLDSRDVDIDITGAQMILVMKLTSFAWSCRDGILYNTDRPRFLKELNQFQRSRAILEQPSLISYLGYVFFYASLVTGPSFDYADYERFILTDVFNDVPENKRPGKTRKRKIPKSGKIAALKVVQGVAWAILLLILKRRIKVEYAESNEFIERRSFFFRIFYMLLLSFVLRLKYYTAWLVSEAACIVVGLGYNGYDPVKNKMYWNRVQNVDSWSFELSQNVHNSLEAWNMNTNKWLKNYVYLRTCNLDAKTGKPISGVVPTFLTFLTSAFWHGTMPGYYLTFVAGAIIQTVGKIFRHNLRPIFITKDGKTVSKWKPAYDIVCLFVTQLSFGYITAPFMILEFKRSIALWKTVYFWLHIASFGILFAFNGPYKKSVSSFFHQYFLESSSIELGKKKKEEQISTETKLADLKDNFGSGVDVSDLLKQENESQQTLPSFDNQDELHDNVALPDFDMVEDGIDKISSEFKEWKEEAMKGKQAKELTDQEIESLKKGLQSLQSDMNYYISSLNDMKDKKE
ncbi:hypothetical protein FOA43_003191 [Brettanomyces nanus]|uniref:Uncharacterized protein n=1 Tax=Eeniella nana TaxID=13502 RepID=A0A875S802_EENNA|nr:uncharacterized protein FOA43_003191 [Brettanomyces nanus]QPG75829.1 hypothetical protein FOA43_003191 [Brettanomyces nanus]